MKISLAKECIKEIFQKTSSVVALISERGVGKTSIFRQCAQEMGVDYMALYAAALEGPDFMGLPDKDREKGITRYLAPQFLPTQRAVNEGLFKSEGLLVLEEINPGTQRYGIGALSASVGAQNQQPHAGGRMAHRRYDEPGYDELLRGRPRRCDD